MSHFIPNNNIFSDNNDQYRILKTSLFQGAQIKITFSFGQKMCVKTIPIELCLNFCLP